MNYCGKWIVHKLMSRDEDLEMIWLDEEEFMASPAYDPDDDFLVKQFRTVYLFGEDGKIKLLLPMPEDVSQEEIDEAVAAGQVSLLDGMLVGEEYDWKTENGKLYAKVDEWGGAENPWVEIPETDGCLEFLTYRLKKAE